MGGVGQGRESGDGAYGGAKAEGEERWWACVSGFHEERGDQSFGGECEAVGTCGRERDVGGEEEAAVQAGGKGDSGDQDVPEVQ